MGRQFIFLDASDLLAIAHRLAIHLFPDYEPDARDASAGVGRVLKPDALQAALALPKQPYYRTTVDKAAALLRGMVKDHPFVDGNKRIGMASTWVFMALNRRVLFPSNEEMVEFALVLADSRPAMATPDVAAWLRRYSINVDAPPDAVKRKVERWSPGHDLKADLIRVDQLFQAVLDPQTFAARLEQ